MKRYVREIAQDILKSISGKANKFTDKKERDEAVQKIQSRIADALNACNRGLISDIEAVRYMIDRNE